MPNVESSLRQRIDTELLKLDYILCERGRRVNVPRPEIAVIGLISSQLDAMLLAFAQNETLWSRFQELVMTPRQTAFDTLFKKAHIPPPSQGGLQGDSQGGGPESPLGANPTGLTHQINMINGSIIMDEATVYAVAYVLGGNSKLLSRFYQSVENHPSR